MRACPLGKASGSAHETERGRVAYPLGKASGSAHPRGAEWSDQNILCIMFILFIVRSWVKNILVIPQI